MWCKLLRLMTCLMLVATNPIFAPTYQVTQNNPQASDDGDGSAAHPWHTISRAAAQVKAGDTVIIGDGIYREAVDIKNAGTTQSPIIFAAATGAHVLLTGADRLTGWEKIEGNQPIYRVPWTHRFITFNANMTHPDDAYHRLIGRCEQVAIDGCLLRQVLSADSMAPGTFFADITNQTLAVWDYGNRDLHKIFVEASTRQEIFRVEGDYVELHGLRFRFAANMAQHGAIILEGNHDTLEDCTMEEMNSAGATFTGKNLVVRRCTFRDNGQLGFGANGADDLLFTECLVENNNIKNFARGWEAGGDKLVLSRHAVLERSRFLRNRGHAIWFDIGNEDCVVRQCLVADNEDSGIFDELSYGLHAHDNVIIDNGFATTTGFWGAQAGISLASSPNAVIERNLIVGNREGFNFREQIRTTPRIGDNTEQPVWDHDETIRRNIIAYNHDAQVWGWFGTKDGREWPAAIQKSMAEKLAEEASRTKTNTGEPTDLTLEKLHLSFFENIYFAGANQGWFEWGASWKRHKSYASPTDFQTGLGIDQGSRALDPCFANLSAVDCRLPARVMTTVSQCYPQGPVPGVILGTQP
jgi:hypothetical protein